MQDEAKPTRDKPWGSDGLAEGEPPPRPHLLRWFDVGFVWFFFTVISLCLLLLSFYCYFLFFCSVFVVTVVVLNVVVELLLMLLFILVGTVDCCCCSIVVILFFAVKQSKPISHNKIVIINPRCDRGLRPQDVLLLFLCSCCYYSWVVFVIVVVGRMVTC